jgi:hypothetical protein
MYTLTVPLGTRHPVRCLISADGLDPANTLHMLTMKTPEPRRILRLDAGMVGTRPFLEAHYAYGTDTTAGCLKMIVAYAWPSAVLCYHDDVGYRTTLRRITESVITSLRIRGVPIPEELPYYEVNRRLIDAQPVGFGLFVAQGSARGLSYHSISSELVPRSESELLATDTFETTVTSDDDWIEHGRYDRVASGEAEFAIQLERQATDRYRVGGQHHGKPVADSFPGPPFPGPGRQGEALAQFLGDRKTRETSFRVFDPGMRIDGPSTTVLERAPAGATYTVTMGPATVPPSQRARATIDYAGKLVRSEAPLLDGRTLVVERLHAQRVP